MMYVTREMGEAIDVGAEPMTITVIGLGRGFVDLLMEVRGEADTIERLKVGVSYQLPVRMGGGAPLAVLKCRLISIQRGQARFGLDAPSDVTIKPRAKEANNGRS